jgi:peroxisomal 3,2-trans-enoyl-CoA isomerase
MSSSLWKFIVWLVNSFKVFFGFASKKQLSKSPLITIVYDEFGVARVTLNRPNKKNAITEQMYSEIEKALTVLSKDRSVKVCLLTGAGDFYCAGNDLSNFSKLMHPLTMAKRGREILEGFVNSFIVFGKPLVVAVNGPAIGIAVTTLGLCDHVFSSDNAYFKTPFAALGQAPEGCSSYTFPKIMGEKVANEVLWNGKVLDANEALKCGLIHSIHPRDELDNVALAYCRELAAMPPHELGARRSALRQEQGIVAKLQEVNIAECEVLQRKWVSKECFSALIKFLESRHMTVAAGFLRYTFASSLFR